MSTVAGRDLTWDLDVYFPGVESPEFKKALEDFARDSSALSGKLALQPAGVDVVATFETYAKELNRLVDASNLLGSYVSALTTTDSYAAAPQRAESRFGMAYADLEKALTSFTAWLGTIDVQKLLSASEIARDHEYVIRKAVEASKHLMTPEAETLASDLNLSGKFAWDRLYGNVTSQISVKVDGFDEALPMSRVRTLAYDADRNVRSSGYKAELGAWKANEVALAAALNAIKGASITLTKARGWSDPLDPVVFSTNMDRTALDAMMEAARESFPTFRRYLKAKAKALGVGKLAFYDVFAPFESEGGRVWTYAEAESFVAGQFDTYSKKLGDFARRTYAERWIDVQPRPGKRDGAYCSGTRGDESRVFMNYKQSFGSVSTLAHELGHAYHNVCLAGRPGLQKDTPMTLAETASTFCETVIRQAAIHEGDEADKLTILEASLQGTTQVVVDITSRFLFEQEVFKRRAAAELAPEEFTEVMLDAQRQTYGDGLDPNALHGFMWAAKPHYYGSDYYNFPYMFGLLFGIGLYAVYRSEPAGFQDRYDELLSNTGRADAASLASKFGIDIRSVDFWRASLAQIAADVEHFEALV